jgi:hypothetical protein
VIFQSAANHLSSPLVTHNCFARISRSIGIFSETERNSSPANLQLQNACDSCSITDETSVALAQVILNHFDKVSSILIVSSCVPHNLELTKSNLTKDLVNASIGTLALFAVSNNFC